MNKGEELAKLDKKIKELDRRILEIDIALFFLVGLPFIILVLGAAGYWIFYLIKAHTSI